MKVKYIWHAISRIQERGITRKDIQEAIVKSKDKKFQPNGRIKCIHKRNNKILVVVYERTINDYKIITAYYKYEN